VVKIPWLDKEILEKMLKRENELRLCEETQNKYYEAEKRSDIDWMKITEELQIRVLNEFEISNIEEGLYGLRTSAFAYPELNDIPLYVKYNRTRSGTLSKGDVFPNVSLVNLDLSIVELSYFCRKKNTPLVIIGGSYS